MSTLSAKALVLSACLLAAPMTSSAQTIFNPNPERSIFDIYPYVPPRCQAVVKLNDGSWLAKQPLSFGRVKVGAGAILWRRTVLGGIDVGALLNRDCGGYEVPPTVRF